MRVRTLTAVFLAIGVSSAASAIFHEIKVKEVFAGSAAHPNAQYIVVQAYSADQDTVTGHSVRTFNAAGASTRDVHFSPGPVAERRSTR